MTIMSTGTRPAFPSATGPGNKGLSQRDYFAAEAMNGFLAGRSKAIEEGRFDELAEIAYKIADAMLKARATQQEEQKD